MEFLLIAGIIALYSWQTLFCALFTKRYAGDPEGKDYTKRQDLASAVFCIGEAFAIALITAALKGFQLSFHWQTIMLGILNAVVLFVYNTSMVCASARGSYSFMNLLMLFGGMVVPAVVGLFAWGSSLKVSQWIAVGVMLVACALMNGGFKLSGAPVSYYVFCLILFLSNGLYGVLIKTQEQIMPGESQEMIMLTFLIMGVIAAVRLYKAEGREATKAFLIPKRAILPLILVLVIAALAINGMVYALTLVDATLYYTVEGGGVLLLAALYSIFLFKEKTTLPQVIGIFLAVISITVLGMPDGILPF